MLKAERQEVKKRRCELKHVKKKKKRRKEAGIVESYHKICLVITQSTYPSFAHSSHSTHIPTTFQTSLRMYQRCKDWTIYWFIATLLMMILSGFIKKIPRCIAYLTKEKKLKCSSAVKKKLKTNWSKNADFTRKTLLLTTEYRNTSYVQFIFKL